VNQIGRLVPENKNKNSPTEIRHRPPDGTKAGHFDYLHNQEINHAREQNRIGCCCPFGYIPGFCTASRQRSRRCGRVKRKRNHRRILYEWHRGFNRTLRRSCCHAVKSKLLWSDRASCKIRNQFHPELNTNVRRKYRCSCCKRRRNCTKRRTDRQPRIRPGLARAALVAERLHLERSAALRTSE